MGWFGLLIWKKRIKKSLNKKENEKKKKIENQFGTKKKKISKEKQNLLFWYPKAQMGSIKTYLINLIGTILTRFQ